jgi:hypothetical protein
VQRALDRLELELDEVGRHDVARVFELHRAARDAGAGLAIERDPVGAQRAA